MSQDSNEQKTSEPWYKHRWPWLLMAGPAIVVVACAFTIYLAFTQNRDTPLVTKESRQGLVSKRADGSPIMQFKPPVDRPIPEHLRAQFEDTK